MHVLREFRSSACVLTNIARFSVFPSEQCLPAGLKGLCKNISTSIKIRVLTSSRPTLFSSVGSSKNVEPLWLLISYQSLFQSEFFSTITFAFFIRSYSKLYISVGIRQSRSPTLYFNVILTNFVLFLNFILQGINDY